MTRAEAAEFVGVSVLTIRRWETTGVSKRGHIYVLQDRTAAGLMLFVRESLRISRNMRPEFMVLAFTKELRELQELDEATS